MCMFWTGSGLSGIMDIHHLRPIISNHVCTLVLCIQNGVYQSTRSNISRSNRRGIKWNNNLHNTLCGPPSHCALSLQACTCGTRCSGHAEVLSQSSGKSEEITYIIDSTGHPRTAPCVSRPVVAGWGILDMLKHCMKQCQKTGKSII